MPKVLVADDSIAVRKVAERLLAEAGFGVALAANGEEAMAYLAKDRPDMIVSDVIMPDKSGYEVCAFVRGNPQLAGMPVLLISGIVNDEVTKQAEFCRADGVLKKPFQGTSLKDKVMELLAKRQQAAAPIGLKPAPTAASAPGYKPMQTQPISAVSHADPQAAIKLREVEEQLRSERAKTQSLEKRVAELEAALKAEQESAASARQEAALAQNSTGQIAQLEAALNAERMAAAQLVQQLTDLEVAAARGKNAEAMLASEMQRAAEFEQKVREAEAELIAVRSGIGSASHSNGADEASADARKVEALLLSERERNAVLAQRVLETEQVAVNATKRFEEMARKLGEIAGLASQLGKGM